MMMIESAEDFWIFIALFAALGGVVLGAVWGIIYRKKP